MTLLLAAVLLSSAQGGQESRLPAPDPAAQKQAEKSVREIFAEDYSRKSPAERKLLAKKLLSVAAETKDDPPVRYVLLREARDLAAEAGDLETALSALGRLEEIFMIDALAAKLALLKTAELQARSPEQSRALAEGYVATAKEALRREEFEIASAAALKAENAARLSKILALISSTKLLSGEVDALRKEWEAARAAQKILGDKPDDADANLNLGKYLCGRKEDWKRGLPMLAKGSDASLREAARKDLSAPEKAEAQIEAGDAWYALADRAGSSGEKKAWQFRARMWYESAVDRLAGLSKLKVEKRLAELDPGGSGPKEIQLLKLVDPAKDQVVGSWVKGDGLLSPAGVVHALIQIPYSPPEEYDLKLEVERKAGTGSIDIGLAVGQSQFLVVIEGWGDNTCGVDRIDGKDSNANETTIRGAFLAAGKPNSIVCSVRKDSLLVTIEGKEIIRWKADYARVSLGPSYVPRNRNVLFLGTMASYAVTSIRLVPVGPEGKALR
jgi:hypothetical protein